MGWSALVLGVAGGFALSACEQGSTKHDARAQPVLRVAVGAEVDRDALERSGRGGDNHLLELIADPAEEHVEVIERRDREVVMTLRRSGDDAADIAARLRYPELVSARASSPTSVVATFASAEIASSFDPLFAGLSGGTHALADAGLVLVPRSEHAVALELVPAPRERHWRLLSGGHVDVAPQLTELEASRLARLDSVVTVEYPITSFVALVVGDRQDIGAAVFEALDVAALVTAGCGPGCGASYPIRPSPIAGGGELPSRVELIYLDGPEPEALAARLVALQLLERGVDVRVRPLAYESYTSRILSRDFELSLAPAPTAPEPFPKYLELMQIPPERLSRTLLPLWLRRLHAAHDASVCDVDPDSATSWGWLARVRPCDSPP